MLKSLFIRNIALIEKLQIDFHPGMNVLSGETGAGKSIIVDSINLVLGERADRGLIRSGCDRASVEAQLDISACNAALAFLESQQLPREEELILFREITSTGRNTCRINGVVVPLTTLRGLTELLVDVHGQHEHQRLMDSKNHLSFLDAFGDQEFLAAKEKTRVAYEEWKAASSHFAALRKENSRRAERQEYLTLRVKELDEIGLQEGEADKLSEEKRRYAGAEKIDESLQIALAQLGGDKGEDAPQKLRKAMQALDSIGTLEPKAAQLSERLANLYYEAQEVGIEVRNLAESQSFDPERFEAISARLDQIRKLERRYGMVADEIVRSHAKMKTELASLSSMEERLKTAESTFKGKLKVYREAAALLTEKRKTLASQMEKDMEAQLKDLGMNRTTFSCCFEEPADSRRGLPTAAGDDQVVFYIAPNPGEPPKPLDQTASGGELSRLMLAFKAAAAEHDDIPCMVFDEIDTGISGHIATAVGEKMADIARFHQVLCVTHLAQIAAMADREFLVRKSVVEERTFTEAVPLEGEKRVEEIARLIGVSDASQQSGYAHAREILSGAEKYKKTR